MSDVPAEASDQADINQWAKDLTYREVHLMVEGFWDGFHKHNPTKYKRLQGTVVGDSWYYKALWIIGYLLKVVVAGGAVTGIPQLLRSFPM